MIPIKWASAAMQWFVQRIGKSYDLWWNIHLTIGFVADSADKYFCPEAIAAALLINEPWRMEPNALYHIVKRLVSATEQFNVV